MNRVYPSMVNDLSGSLVLLDRAAISIVPGPVTGKVRERSPPPDFNLLVYWSVPKVLVLGSTVHTLLALISNPFMGVFSVIVPSGRFSKDHVVVCALISNERAANTRKVVNVFFIYINFS